MKIKWMYPVLLCALLFPQLLSCDLLRSSPFEVASWSPGAGFHPGYQALQLSFSFSHDPDKLSVERVFSVTEDGTQIQGTISWNGRTLFFYPISPLSPNREYRVSILTDAHDTKGLSMDKNFDGVFYTRPAGNRPSVLSISPADDTVTLNPLEQVYITFSQPMDILSCRSTIAFSPAAKGTWMLDSGGTRAVFTPSEPLTMGTTYQVTISNSASSSLGISMGKDFKSRFTFGNDKTAPDILGVYAIDSNGTTLFQLTADDPGGTRHETPDWETTNRFRLDFSEPVNSTTLASRVILGPSGNLKLETAPGLITSAVYRTTERLSYNEHYDLRIETGIADASKNKSETKYTFRFFTNGVNSKPPALIGIRIPRSPGEANPDNADPLAYAVTDIFEDLPIDSAANKYIYDTATSTWIELYFDTAPGTAVSEFSLMNLFRVDAGNSALSFSPRSIKSSGFTWTAPHAAWAAYSRIEVKGILTNRSNSGLISFIIGSGLLDMSGNRNDKEFRIPLLK